MRYMIPVLVMVAELTCHLQLENTFLAHSMARVGMAAGFAGTLAVWAIVFIDAPATAIWASPPLVWTRMIFLVYLASQVCYERPQTRRLAREWEKCRALRLPEQHAASNQKREEEQEWCEVR